MVSVERAVVPLVIVKPDPFGVNEHTGAMATRGAIEPHASVMPPSGLRYPLLGLMLTTPCAPLPAGTLPGETWLWIVIVNCGVTASTVKSRAGLVYVVVGPVPVIVIE